MEENKTDAGQGLGIAGFVLGIVALIVAFIPCVGVLALIPGIIAITLSGIAYSQANKGNGAKGLIIAALVISILGTAVAAIWPLAFASVAKTGLFMKKNIENAIEDETGKTMDENFKDLGKDMEQVLEHLEADTDSGVIKIEIGKEMGDAEFDKFLGNYEKLINESIQLQKKAESGDMEAVTAYSKISVKLASTLSKLATSSSKLTPVQAKKLNEINKKYEKELESIRK
jgi:predicted transcriptional regulator